MQTEKDINDQIKKAVEIIGRGGLVAFPTDTVYCLGTDPLNPEAVAKIYDVKERPREMACPVIVSNMDQLHRVCEVPPLGRYLAAEFFPVGFTLVMPKSPDLPDIVTAGKKTVAVRIQDNPIASRIAEKLKMGVVGTSANIHHMKSPKTGDEVKEQIGNRIDLIIYGECSGGVESTIVDVTSDKPLILRVGAIPASRVEEAWERYQSKAGK